MITISEINKLIDAATTPQALFDVMDKHWDNFDCVHLVNTLEKMSEMSLKLKAESNNPENNQAVAIKQQLTFLKLKKFDKEYWAKIFNLAQKSLVDYSPHNISRLASAFAKLEFCSQPLLDSIASHVLRIQFKGFAPYHLVSLVWAFSKLGNYQELLLEGVAKRVIESRAEELDPYNMAALVISYARLGKSHKSLFKLIATKAIASNFKGFSAQHLANIAWSYAALNYDDLKFFQSLIERFNDPTNQLQYTDKNYNQILHFKIHCDSLPFKFKWNSEFVDKMTQEIERLPTPTSSNTHLEIFQRIKMIAKKLPFKIEKETPLSGYFVDITIIELYNQKNKIAVEVLGPSHYNQKGELLGNVLFKKRILQALGYQWVEIPVDSYYKLDPDEKSDYLNYKLPIFSAVATASNQANAEPPQVRLAQPQARITSGQAPAERLEVKQLKEKQVQNQNKGKGKKPTPKQPATEQQATMLQTTMLQGTQQAATELPAIDQKVKVENVSAELLKLLEAMKKENTLSVPSLPDVRAIITELQHNQNVTSIEFTGLNTAGITLLSSAFRSNRTLLELNLLGNHKINSAQEQPLAFALTKNTTLRSFHFSNSSKSINGENLVKAFKVNKTLTDISLENIKGNESMARDLAEILKTSHVLTSFSLWECSFGRNAETVFAEALEQNNTLTFLRLIWCFPAGGEPIVQKLKKNKTLTVLHLGGNQLSGDGIKNLCEIIRTNKTLTHLNLSENNLNPMDGKLLCEAIRINLNLFEVNTALNNNLPYEVYSSTKSFTERNYLLGRLKASEPFAQPEASNFTRLLFKIAENRVDGELTLPGAHEIGKLDDNKMESLGIMLANNTSIRTLNLSDNALGPEPITFAPIRISLLTNKTLTSLSFFKLNFPQGFSGISYILQDNKTLTSLSFVRCTLNFYLFEQACKSLMDLGKALKSNGNIKRLDFSGSLQGLTDAVYIVDALKYNQSLIHLNLSENNLSAGSENCIIQALLANNTLESLDLSKNKLDTIIIEKVLNAVFLGNQGNGAASMVNRTLTELNFSENIASERDNSEIAPNVKYKDYVAKKLAEILKLNKEHQAQLRLPQAPLKIPGEVRALTFSALQETSPGLSSALLDAHRTYSILQTVTNARGTLQAVTDVPGTLQATLAATNALQAAPTAPNMLQGGSATPGTLQAALAAISALQAAPTDPSTLQRVTATPATLGGALGATNPLREGTGGPSVLQGTPTLNTLQSNPAALNTLHGAAEPAPRIYYKRPGPRSKLNAQAAEYRPS